MYDNPKAKKYEDELKAFLSKKIKEGVISKETLNRIIDLAMQKTQAIKTDSDIVHAISELESKFKELHELKEHIHSQNSSAQENQRDLVISQVASQLLLENIDIGRKVLDFTKQHPEASLEDFYDCFPNYKELGNKIISNSKIQL